MNRLRLVLGIAALALAIAPTAQSTNRSQFATAVQDILAQPYQSTYAPAGFDSAFGDANVPNTAPAEDFTSGSIPGSPDHPSWPAWFRPVRFASATARSIAPEGSAGSIRLRVTRGRERTWGGKSHSCDTPTSRPIAPSAATISVAAGSNDTMRMPII